MSEQQRTRRIHVLHNNDNLFSIYIFIPAGSIYENKKLRGASHFLEHMLFRNSRHIVKDLTMMGKFNAATYKDITYYYINTTMANMEKAIATIHKLVDKPMFTENDLEVEKKVVLEEYHQHVPSLSHDMEQYVMQSLHGKRTSYSHPVIGTKKAIEDVTLCELKDYFHKRYQNFTITVNCPKKDTHRVYKALYSIFDAHKLEGSFDLRKEAPAFNKEMKKIDPSVVVFRRRYSQNITRMIFPAYRANDGHNGAILALLGHILTASSLHSILYKEIREKRGLIYSIQSYAEALRYVGYFNISFMTSHSDIAYVLNIIFSVIHHVKTHGVTNKQLAYYKKSFKNTYHLNFADTSYTTEWSGMNHFYGDTILQPRSYFTFIEDITNEDIKRVASEVLEFNNMGIITLGDYNDPDKISSRILEYMKTYTQT